MTGSAIEGHPNAPAADAAPASELIFEVPGRGQWKLELSHFGGRMTPLYRDVYVEASEAGMAAATARYGLPFSHFALAFVHDHVYLRVAPLVDPPGPAKAPPAAVVWLLSRLHPAFRSRRRAGQAAVASQLWLADTRAWNEVQRPALVEAALAFQDEPLVELPDDELADHVERVAAFGRDGTHGHFTVVSAAMVAASRLVAAAIDWGLPPAELVALTRGLSPMSAETRRWLVPMAVAARRSSAEVRSLDDIRRLGPQVAQTLDDYLRHFGQRVLCRYDVDAPTLVEQPDVVLASIRALAARSADETSTRPVDPAPFRARVPEVDRARFDQLFADVVATYPMRDDNAGIALQWSAGLLRRAALEAGRRLAATGAITEPEHVFDMKVAELGALLRGEPGPDGPALAHRNKLRRRNEATNAPLVLGTEAPPPPMRLLPEPLSSLGAGALACVALLERVEGTRPLDGAGIGTVSYRGRARVAFDPIDAVSELEPGDVLVVPFTTPAYNAVLPIVGALVVEEGGLLSHAALVAREFGIPAVIGAAGATDLIHDGVTVEVDPVAGRVVVVGP